MSNHNTTKIAAAALLAAAALGGCGKSSDNNVAPAPAVPTSTTPATTASVPPTSGVKKASWANQLCTTLTEKAKPVQPPSVQSTSPEDTKASLVTFFTTVISTQTIQLETLKAVGPPPSKNATSDWKKSIKELRGIRKQVTKVEENLSATPATNKAQLAKVISTLGKETKTLSAYNGPVSALAKNAAIGAQLKAEPACSALL